MAKLSTTKSLTSTEQPDKSNVFNDLDNATCDPFLLMSKDYQGDFID